MKLLVIGHTNIDVQLHMASLPKPGESSPVETRRTVYGGTACNIARHAAGMGVDARLWSRVGADFPQSWRDALQQAGVDLAHFDATGTATPTCYILTDETHQSYCMDQAAMTPPYGVDPAALDGVDWLHVCTGDPASYLPLVQEAKRRGIRIALDPGQEIHFAYDSKSFEELLELSDVVFLNEHEMDRALGFFHYGAAEQLLDHVDHIVATHGKKGAALHSGDGVQQVPAMGVEVVDPTGAGDALRAGWYAALARGLSMAEALGWGVEAAGVCVTFSGPQERTITLADLAVSA